MNSIYGDIAGKDDSLSEDLLPGNGYRKLLCKNKKGSHKAAFCGNTLIISLQAERHHVLSGDAYG